LLQRKIDIVRNDIGASLHDRLGETAPEALLESLNLLQTGKAPRIPQDKALATYAAKLDREAGRIDWNESAEQIERKIRAYNPWPGAFTEFEDRRLKVFSAEIVNLRGKPGATLREDRELVIATSDRALSLTAVQSEGKRRMTASEFLRGLQR
jgi:methionyl-tRNA formyltransferase